MNQMFRSATFKLTLWYIAIVMAISLMFSFILYSSATNELDRGINGETYRISRQFPVFRDTRLLKPGEDYANASHRLLMRLVGFNLVVLVGAGFASYWLARRTLEPIQAAHEQQKRFTADVSHELRTPLTALRMESEVALMNDKASARELRAALTSNLEEVTKLEALINNLLKLTRLEADELRQHFTRLNSRTITKTALEQAQTLADTRKITLNSQLADLPLQGDRESLVQLLVILLDNAIKYSPSGAVVTVTSKQDEGAAIIAIEDHGQGIAPDALEHVFDRFYRADKSRTKASADKSEGYGLGLSIAKMIADLHGGTIHLSSQLGRGTTATLHLPLAATASKDQKQ